MASAAVSGSEARDKRLYSSGNEGDLSGIVGVWNRDGRPLGAAVVHAMNQTLSHRGPDGSDVHVAETVGFAHQHLWVTIEEIGERQPIVSGRGVMLAFDGRLDNRDELNRLLDLSGARERRGLRARGLPAVGRALRRAARRRLRAGSVRRHAAAPHPRARSDRRAAPVFPRLAAIRGLRVGNQGAAGAPGHSRPAR